MTDDVRPDGLVSWTTSVRRASGLHVVDGVVYVAADDGVTAFAAASGSRLWACGGVRTMLAAPGERVLFTGFDQGVAALDRVTGAEVWAYRVERAWIRAPRPSARLGLSVPLRRRLWGSMERADQVAEGIVVCAGGGAVAAFEVDTGRRLWRRWLRRGSHVSTADPDGTVVITSFRDGTMALDPLTARMLWRRRDRPDVHHLADRRVRLADGPILIDPRTGEPRVRLQTRGTRWRLCAEHGGLQYAVVDGVLDPGSGDGVVAFDARGGDVVWTAGPDLVPSPRGFGAVRDACVTDEAVYAVDGAGRVRAWDPVGGAVRWTSGPYDGLPDRERWFFGLTVDHGVVVVTAEGGHVLVLDRSTGRRLRRWTDPNATARTGQTLVAVDADRVYFAGVGILYALPVRQSRPEANRRHAG